jgi:hypothetical protein
VAGPQSIVDAAEAGLSAFTDDKIVRSVEIDRAVG